ncbi:Hypothetical predicted protein [Olea europaea subsp. europaea]|uniref:Uncharacterized protein n=1 Tax=Olea europaea subsp. europaea TaxID=158383 RepID=A0A8S0UD83_OLEEU|nr:Hypothetical predicted protein [Olea europaea subsp. europaea]
MDCPSGPWVFVVPRGSLPNTCRQAKERNFDGVVALPNQYTPPRQVAHHTTSRCVSYPSRWPVDGASVPLKI